MCHLCCYYHCNSQWFFFFFCYLMVVVYLCPPGVFEASWISDHRAVINIAKVLAFTSSIISSFCFPSLDWHTFTGVSQLLNYPTAITWPCPSSSSWLCFQFDQLLQNLSIGILSSDGLSSSRIFLLLLLFGGIAIY